MNATAAPAGVEDGCGGFGFPGLAWLGLRHPGLLMATPAGVEGERVGLGYPDNRGHWGQGAKSEGAGASDGKRGQALRRRRVASPRFPAWD